MVKLKNNPFSPGGIVKSSLFGGRHQYIMQILRKLHSVAQGKPASFYLYGERGIGKTALAKLISFISTEKDPTFYNLNFLVSYYSAQHNQSFKSILESSLNNIADQIDDSVLKKIGSRLGKVFKDGKFSIGAFGVSAGYQYDSKKSKDSELEIITIKDQVVSILRNVLAQIKNIEYQEKSKDGVLFIIDEMDNIEDIEICASIIRGITTELDFEDIGNISFMLIGYENGYEHFIKGDESIRRLLDPIQLKEMPNEEVIETFEKGLKESNITWNAATLKEKVWQTGGYPLAIQVIGYHLIEEDSDGNIDSDDWEKAVSKSSKELIHKEYSMYYSFGSAVKKNKDRILFTLAVATVNSDSYSLKEIQELSSIKNPSQYIKQLLNAGVVFKNKSNAEFSIKRGLLRTAIILDALEFDNSAVSISQVSKILDESQKLANKKKVQKTE